MYQVIKLYGDWEPWWFFKGWERDIVEETLFDNFAEASSFYNQESHLLQNSLPHSKCYDNFQAAFWTQKEQRWCENCGDYLQQYHSLIMLKNGNPFPRQSLSNQEEQYQSQSFPNCSL